MKPKYGLIFVAALFAITVGVAVAQMGMGKMGAGPRAGVGQGCDMDMGMGMGWFGRGINLTPDQTAQLKKINTDFNTANAPLRTDMMARHKELAALLAAPVLDETAIRAKMAEIETLRDRMGTAKTEKLIASMRVLTAEQRAQIGERMKNRPGMGMGQGRGAGAYGGRHRGGAGTLR